MEKLNELQKEMISNQIFRLTDNFNDDELDYAIYIMKFWKEERKRQDKENKRTCSECSKEMKQGYCIENGMEYYCSDECLHKNMTQDEYLELYDNGNGDSYWTEWED